MIPEGSINPLKVLWETAEEILAEAQYVEIPNISYTRFTDELIGFDDGFHGTPYPKGVENEEELVLYYLIRDSVNFCYWYGMPSIRPNGSNSGKVAAVLSKEFETTSRGPLFAESVIYQFGQKLKKERFPNITERIDCLAELNDHQTRDRILHAVKYSPESTLEILIEKCPRYTSDVFLKRASLFVGELFKGSQWTQGDASRWPAEIYNIPVPADYHLPNVLRYLGLVRYKPDLADMVQHNVLLPKGSRVEVEIRAATVHVCQTLSLLAKVAPPVVDEYLFSLRNKAIECHPFHLTQTTDY